MLPREDMLYNTKFSSVLRETDVQRKEGLSYAQAVAFARQFKDAAGVVEIRFHAAMPEADTHGPVFKSRTKWKTIAGTPRREREILHVERPFGCLLR